jgi:adenine deaminase
MRRLVTVGIGVLLAASVAIKTTERPAAQPVSPADLVLLNGKILTVDARDSIAQAVAIAGGKIVAVGSNEDVRARIGSNTQTIDLRGRTATPDSSTRMCISRKSMPCTPSI